MIQSVTIRRSLDPTEALAEHLYHSVPGDLAMFMRQIQRHDYPGAMRLARDLWAPMYAETFLGPMMIRPGLSVVETFRLMVYLRDQVVHPA